jgi:hypothetical protein
MEPLEANFLLVKVEEDVWDVCIFGDEAILKAFEEVYSGHYIEKSVFENKPMLVIPEFPNRMQAESWKEYWLEAFSDPQNACKGCVTVNELFDFIKEFKKPWQ